MKTSLRIAIVLLLPAAVAMAQFPADPNNPNGGQPPGGQPQGNVGGPGPRAFFGPPPNAMFSLIDADGDGVITKPELRRAVAQLRKLDADKDGNITLAEASAGGPGGPGGPFGDPAQFVDRMMQNDKNGDGKLTIDEVPEFMKPMLEGADTNGDGAIDRNELAAAAQNMRNRFPGPGGFPGGPGGFRGAGGFADRPFDATQMTGRFMQNDRNGDGKLTADEVPPQAMGMLQGGDQNGDGAIDAAEMQAIMRRMGERARGLNAGLGPGGNNDAAPSRDNGARGRLRAREEN